MPTTYLIVESKISDPERFKAYMAGAPAAIRAFAGSYLARGGRLEVLEGNWVPPRLTVLAFPSFDIAKAWYDSPAYTEVRALRDGATEVFNMVLVEGVETAP
jgi:uncharacterized protein (DUF1330 family)